MTLVDGSALPTFISWTEVNRTLYIESSNNDAGAYQLRYACDDTLNAVLTTDFTITITPNLPPSINNIPETRFEMIVFMFFSFEFPMDAFVDPEGLPLTIEIVPPLAKTLPQFMRFNADNNTLYGVTTYADIGEYKFILQGTDTNGQSVEVTMLLYINACYYKCLKCFGAYAYECTACLPGFSYHDFYCLDECPVGRYSENLVCVCQLRSKVPHLLRTKF